VNEEDILTSQQRRNQPVAVWWRGGNTVHKIFTQGDLRMFQNESAIVWKNVDFVELTNFAKYVHPNVNVY